MSKKILIDTSSDEETRIALTDNGKLDDFEIEPVKKIALKGDVYLAKITRVEPSLQAAFVDFGAHRHGFLPLTEIHPDYFKIPISDQKNLKKLSSEIQLDEEIDELTNKKIIKEKNKNDLKEESTKDYNEIDKKKYNDKKNYLNFFRKYRIQEVIKPQQVILVQINKEERGMKGAALTTFLSFAGRYCVLMPNSLNNDGISRKIADIEERKKLKTILESINIPEKMSVIIRTAGTGKTKKEINKDLNFLTSQWNKIREKTLKSAAPSIIYEEGNLIKRTIRDLLTSDVNEVIIDGKKGYSIAKKYAQSIMPTHAKNIKLFKKKDKSLFNDNNIEHQINDLFSLKVTLESGGSIVINTTEALVAIDVNSGKNTFERNIENTALKTNLEATIEIARQLRLRDLGGLVVIDFIDMDDYRNNFKVEKSIKTALYRDRARVQVGRISMFGLLELSRQRLRSSLIERSFEKCQNCNGSGIIHNTASISEHVMKIINEKLADKKKMNLEVRCNTALADFLLNKKKEEIQQIEKKHDSRIQFTLSNHHSLHEPTITSSGNEEKLLNKISKQKEVSKTKEVTKKKERKPIKKIAKTKKISRIKYKIIEKKEKTKVKDKNQKNKIEIVEKNKEKIGQEETKQGWWSE